MTMIAYLAPAGFINELTSELAVNSAVHGDLVILEQAPAVHPVWAQNVWLDPVYLEITSIGSAAKQLRNLQLRWWNYAFHLHRRTELIQQQLPKLKFPPLSFLGALPEKPIGSWALLNENLILASPHCLSRFPNGEIHFQENKTDPPSRAYLKLWEVFTLHGVKPNPGDICLDLGSSPGGWTWVLAQMNCQVISVDKAPLDARLLKSPRVNYLNRSAFSIQPAEIGRIDWLFSDVICYPQRLLTLIKTWLESGLCKNFVCTIKLQGPADKAILNEFAAIPNSRLLHLYHNKHELTWFCTASVKD
jgi:23S rRNA (cytidine2498-2'-O)-methyltransferase